MGGVRFWDSGSEWKKTWIRGKECTQWMADAKFNPYNIQCPKFSGAHEERLGWKI